MKSESESESGKVGGIPYTPAGTAVVAITEGANTVGGVKDGIV